MRPLAFLSPGAIPAPALTKAHLARAFAFIRSVRFTLRWRCPVAVRLADLARRLRELIAALDRRAPRIGDAAEPGIARDAAALRERAVDRLAEIGDQPTRASDGRPDRVG